ncbi:MAG: YncE family protein [Mycobacteriales bacterium]
MGRRSRRDHAHHWSVPSWPCRPDRTGLRHHRHARLDYLGRGRCWRSGDGLGAPSPRTNTIYVADAFQHTVSVVNGRTNTVAATIRLGDGPGALAVNPLTDTVLAGGAGRVSVINGRTNQVTASVGFGQYAVDVDINPVTNKAYVSYAHGVKVIGGLPH